MIRVVDASVVAKWLVPEALSEQATRLLEEEDDDLLAPDLLLVEVANALWKKTARGELTSTAADRALELMLEAGLELRGIPPLLSRATKLARELGHPVYDCVYLALAEAERAPLVTADERLLRRLARHPLGAMVVRLDSV